MKQQELFARMERMGVHTQDALSRFMGNERLFLSFVRQLPEKLDFTCLRQELEDEDEESFYINVHNLKGMAGNLSIEPIYNCTQAILEEFRSSRFKNKMKLETLICETETKGQALKALINQYIEEEHV